MKRHLSLFLFLFLSLNLVHAAFLRNIPRTLIQPNGDTLHCFISGDEFYNYLHDAEGYTIVQDVNTGYFVYAAKIGGEIMPTTHLVGKIDPASMNLTPHVIISPEEWMTRRGKMMNAVPQASSVKSSERNRGHINNLVIPIRFQGDAEITTTFSAMETMFNDSSSVTANSMHTYFKTASYNQLSIVSYFYPQPVNDVVVSYEDIYTRNYYLPYSILNPDGYSDYSDRTSREFALLARAVEHVKDSISTDLDLDYDGDGQVDNVVFVIKGTVGDWNDLLWPHRWSLYGENVYIGDLRVWDFNFQLESSSTYFNNSVLCHEMFHTLGAPDLYRYYHNTDVHPVGSWDLMEVNTTPPQHSGAYMKMKYGNWIDSIPEITEPGTYSLHPIGSTTSESLAYKIASSDPEQFYVVEFRNNTLNFETGIPGSGLLIYRIDSRFTGNASYDNVNTFDEVYLFRPGGDATTNGNYNIAHFGNHVNRNAFNPNTDPAPFLTQDMIDLLDISEIAIQGDSLVFTYNNSPFFASEDFVILTSQEGSYADFNITSNVSWQIGGGHQGWLDWSPTSGNGSESVRVTATSSNLDGNSRVDTLVISVSGMPDKLVRIFQNDFTFVVSDTLINFSNEGGRLELEIISDAYWRIFSLPSWISASPMYGQSTATSVLTASSYNGADSRSARFYVYCSDYIIYVTAVQQGTNSTHDFTVSSLSVYPNPMGNTLHIKQNNPVANIQKAEIFNLTGKLLLAETCGNTSTILSVSHLPQGMYILQIIFENGERERIKIVK